MTRLVPENRQVLGPSHARLIRGRPALPRWTVADRLERSSLGCHWMHTAGRGRRPCQAGRAHLTRRLPQIVRPVIHPEAGWER